MNAVKKYIRSKGYKLESDYPYMPLENGLQAVVVDSENVTIYHYYVQTGGYITSFNRNGSLAWEDNE